MVREMESDGNLCSHPEKFDYKFHGKYINISLQDDGCMLNCKKLASALSTGTLDGGSASSALAASHAQPLLLRCGANRFNAIEC